MHRTHKKRDIKCPLCIFGNIDVWTAGILLKITVTEETNGRAVIDLDEQQMDEEY